MSNVTISPNMSLIVPNVGTDPGPDWANNLNASLSILDQHNHSPGSGVQIQPSGLNINSNLSFQNNQAIGLQASVYTAQSSLATLDAVYVKGVDLYFNDGSGNVIQMTAGGSVNATSSGISDGTATASFVSSVLVVNAAATTPANIQVGSVLLGNNSAGSKFLTLSPPSAMAANFGLVLPNIPAAQQFLSIDASGNIAGYANVSGGLTASNLSASAGIAGTQIANGTITASQIAPNTILAANINPAAGIYNSQILANTIDNTRISTTTLNSGVYTPSYAVGGGITLTATDDLNWMLVNGICQVGGCLTGTITSSTFSLTMTIPLATGNFDNNIRAGGALVGQASGCTAGIRSVSGTQTVTIIGTFAGSPPGPTSDIMPFSFTYRVP